MTSLAPAYRLVALSILMATATPFCRGDAAAEVTAALEKLHATTYRQRDHVIAMVNVPGGVMSPPVTEHSHGRTRLVSEIKHPSVGLIRTEQITIDSRSAVRTTAPALLAKLNDAKRKLTVSSARSLLQQIVSAASAVQTGGLTAAAWIMEATRAATTIKTTAQARMALDRAIEGFASWQLINEEEDSEMPDLPDGMSPSGNSDSMSVVQLPRTSDSLVGYRRKPADAMPGVEFYSVLTVDTTTGYPVAEENYLNGQRMMRTEFFDIGAPIQIETPDCLK